LEGLLKPAGLICDGTSQMQSVELFWILLEQLVIDFAGFEKLALSVQRYSGLQLLIVHTTQLSIRPACPHGHPAATGLAPGFSRNDLRSARAPSAAIA
jgi:hypothetical protein